MNLLEKKEVSQALEDKGKDNALPNTEIEISGELLSGKVHRNRLAYIKGVGFRNLDLLETEVSHLMGIKVYRKIKEKVFAQDITSRMKWKRMKKEQYKDLCQLRM